MDVSLHPKDRSVISEPSNTRFNPMSPYDDEICKLTTDLRVRARMNGTSIGSRRGVEIKELILGEACTEALWVGVFEKVGGVFALQVW